LPAARTLHFERGKPLDRAAELAAMKRRKPGVGLHRGAHVERTWSEEHVSVHRDRAVFLGKASEVEGGTRRRVGTGTSAGTLSNNRAP
jgi:hypothetical protein